MHSNEVSMLKLAFFRFFLKNKMTLYMGMIGAEISVDYKMDITEKTASRPPYLSAMTSMFWERI